MEKAKPRSNISLTMVKKILLLTVFRFFEIQILFCFPNFILLQFFRECLVANNSFPSDLSETFWDEMGPITISRRHVL